MKNIKFQFYNDYWLCAFNHTPLNFMMFYCFYFQSEKAGQISRHQLLVAMRLGNPILAAQCKVFAAMSLIQRGRLKMASKVIRCVTAGLGPWVYQWFISKPYCINKISIWIVAFCIAFFCSLGWTRVGCLCYFFHQLPPTCM